MSINISLFIKSSLFYYGLQFSEIKRVKKFEAEIKNIST